MNVTEKCFEISKHILFLLDNNVISEALAERLASADEELIDQQYAEALIRWEEAGRDPLDSFVTNNALFLHFSQAIQDRFGLEILSPEDSAERAMLLRNQTWLPEFVGSC